MPSTVLLGFPSSRTKEASILYKSAGLKYFVTATANKVRQMIMVLDIDTHFTPYEARTNMTKYAIRSSCDYHIASRQSLYIFMSSCSGLFAR
jgi:hypothetical protein